MAKHTRRLGWFSDPGLDISYGFKTDIFVNVARNKNSDVLKEISLLYECHNLEIKSYNPLFAVSRT